MKNYLLLIVACFLGILSGCKKENSNYSASDSSVFSDRYGRTLILHGASLYTNDDPGGYIRYNSNSAKRLVNEWGLNSVRLFWNWNAIEPDSAVFAPDRLDSLVKVVKTFTDEGIYVVLAVNGTATSSQDKLRGTWQAPYGNAVDNPSLPGNANPAQQEATRRFWDHKHYAYLQDEFIKASVYVAARLKGDPYVLGYDIINEPWGDGLISTTLNTNLETQLLPGLYEKYIREMRKTEPDKYILFEPRVLFNIKELANFETKLPLIKDERNGVKHLSFAPHCYLQDPTKNTIQNSYDQYLGELKKKYAEILRFQQVPIYLGEWSDINYATFPDAENYLNKHMAAFDEIMISWSYFGYFPGNPNDVSDDPALDLASRVYPRATAGKLRSFVYDPVTKEFNMSFIANTGIAQPTEIFIPHRYFPNGYNLAVNGTSAYTQTFDPFKNVLLFSVSDNNKEITLQISPK